jgi:putative ABC transport system permease protein
VNFVALRMLIGDRAKYVGIVVGLTFASLLITQQLSIFTGLMTRTYGAITDLGQPDVWVMDPKVQFIDDIKPMQSTALYRTRGVEGVEWAVPLYKGLLKARLRNGTFQTVNLYGLDDATLIGGPPEMLEGRLEDLRRSEGVIVDEVGANGKLALAPRNPGDPLVPLKVGDTLEINDHRAIVVGICRVQRTFLSQPVVFTTYSRAIRYAPNERKLLSFVLVGTKRGADVGEVCDRIRRTVGVAARPREEFMWQTVSYYMKYTGIPVNFGIAVALGFLVGTVIAGQTFHNFTLDNLKQFGALKAMGARTGTLLRMIVLQALLVGAIGYGLGVGLASLAGLATKHSELAFKMPWQILVISAGSILVICTISAIVAMRKVIRLEPAIVFKT